jgi:protoporphyrinogen oxidase
MYGLGLSQGLQILASFLKARLTPDRMENSFEDWVSNRFGRALYTIFFQSYTEKVWGIPCSELSADWATQRIKDLDFTRAALNAMGFYRNRESATLAESFHYPRFGPGQMYDKMASRIEEAGSRVLPNHKAFEIHHEKDRIRSIVAQTPDGTVDVLADHFISSMALDDLVRSLRPLPPPGVLEAANNLRYRAIMTANLIIDQPTVSPDNWIYLHAPEIKAARLQLYKNWSPDLVPDDQTSSVGLEYFASKGDSFWSLPDDEILKAAKEDLARLELAKKAQAKDGCVVRYAKAYPVYDVGYARRLSLIREYLARFENLVCIGRSGQFRYNNMDHSIYTGLLAVRKFAGEKVNPWDVNVDEDYLESSG